MSKIRKESVTLYAVAEEEAGQRLDNFLVRICKGVPKSHLYRILRSGEVRINGGRVKADTRIVAGDKVRIPPLRVSTKVSRSPAPAGDTFDVVYEDDGLLAVNKPAGVAVHGGSGISHGVIERLRAQRPDARFLELAHRLDRETSGLLLVAKKRSVLRRLHVVFREHQLDKRYLVLVRGTWHNPVQHVKVPLNKYLTEEGERRVSVASSADSGKAAHSIFRLQARWANYSLLEAQILTGRTHQIRVHLAHLGFPIVGDDKYGDFHLNKQLAKEGLKRMFLHAWRLSLDHPCGEGKLVLEAPLAVELQHFLDGLDAREGRTHG